MSRAPEARYFIATILIVVGIVSDGIALAEPPVQNEIGAQSAKVASAIGDAHLLIIQPTYGLIVTTLAGIGSALGVKCC